MDRLKDQVYFSLGFRADEKAVKLCFIEYAYARFQSTALLGLHGVKKVVLRANDGLSDAHRFELHLVAG